MERAVLISIKPKWIWKIAGGEKTLEIRKSAPDIEPPYTCYMYCTMDKSGLVIPDEYRDPTCLFGTPYDFGRVVGEFVCDETIRFCVPYPAFMHEMDKDIMKMSCLDYMQLHKYGGHRPLTGLHISNLKIYSYSIPLSNFSSFNANKKGDFTIKRPPQSWMYVKKMQEDLGGTFR